MPNNHIISQREMLAQSVRNAMTAEQLMDVADGLRALSRDWSASEGEVKSTSREEHENPDGHLSKIEVNYKTHMVFD